MSDGSTWVDKGGTCPNCHYPGKHLQVDNSLLYCGRCKTIISSENDD